MPAPMISRFADPILGVATGCLAFWLNENDIRSCPPEGYTLYELVRWKWPPAIKAPSPAGKDDEGMKEFLKEIGVETK